MALHADVDVGDSEIPALQIGGRLAPRHNARVGWQIGPDFGPPLNPVIGERGVAAVFGIAPRHVAANAVALLAGMRGRKVHRVARKASRAIIRDGLRGLVVRIVARSTPEPPSAVSRARAQRQLFDMADHLESPRWRARRRRVAIDSERIFQSLPRDEIAELFSGIQDASRSEEMTLLANGVAGRWLELCRIDDCSGPRIREVSLDRAVAAFACDRFRGKNGSSILI